MCVTRVRQPGSHEGASERLRAVAKAKKAAKKAVKKSAKKAASKKKVGSPKSSRPAAKKTVKKAKAVKNKAAAAPKKAKAAPKPARRKAAPKKVVSKKAVVSKAAPKKVKLKRSSGAVEAQQKVYSEGVDLLNKRKFSQAVSRFEKALAGPDSGLRHSATVYLRICNQRLQSAPEPKSAEDRYNAAVALINNRQLTDAERLLGLALRQEPKGAHLHYAVAVTAALSGRPDDAANSLGKAIQLDPQTRILALRDNDLAELRDHPAVSVLLSDREEDSEAAAE